MSRVSSLDNIYQLLTGTTDMMTAVTRSMQIDDNLNWHTGFSSREKIIEIKNSYSEDESMSFYQFFVNLCLIIQKLFKFQDVNTRNTYLQFHNLLKKNKMSEGIIVMNLSLLQYLITKFTCDENTIKNDDCRNMYTYISKLAYSIIAVLIKYSELLFQLVNENTENYYYNVLIPDTFNAYNISPVLPEEEWQTLDNIDLLDDLRNLQNNMITTRRIRRNHKINIENSITDLLLIPLNKLVKEIAKYQVLTLTTLATLSIRNADIQLSTELIPSDIVDIIVQPLRKVDVTTPRRIHIERDQAGGRRRNRRSKSKRKKSKSKRRRRKKSKSKNKRK